MFEGFKERKANLSDGKPAMMMAFQLIFFSLKAFFPFILQVSGYLWNSLHGFSSKC